SSVRLNCFMTSGLFQNCPFANPNERSIGGRCWPKPGSMPGPSGPCAQAQPPAITTPATAKTSRTAFNILIDFSRFGSQRTFSRLLFWISLVSSTSPSICSGAFHHLRQRLHGRRNLPRYIAVYRCQQIFIFTGCPLHRGWLPLGNDCGLDRLF